MLVYTVLSYKCMRPSDTSVCGLKLLVSSQDAASGMNSVAEKAQRETRIIWSGERREEARGTKREGRRDGESEGERERERERER
jgi:hypothetical protein